MRSFCSCLPQTPMLEARAAKNRTSTSAAFITSPAIAHDHHFPSPDSICLWNLWMRSSKCGFSNVTGACTNPEYNDPNGKCGYGQFTFGGESCPCDGGVVECACTTKARAKEGLESKKGTLTLLGWLLLPASGLWAALTWWCLTTDHKTGQCCRADQRRKEENCARCTSPATARGCTHFGNAMGPLACLVGAIVCLALAGKVDVDKDYWEGCP